MSNKIDDIYSKRMNTVLIISKNMTQVRVSPGTSDVKVVLDKGPTEYHTTRIQKGWYFIEELKGWVYYKDVYIPHPEEIIPEDDVIYDTTIDVDVEDKPNNKDADDIIELINSASKSISGDKILLKVNGNKMYDLDTCMSMILDDIHEINKLKIPEIPDGINNAILSYQKDKDDKVKLVWIEQKTDSIVVDNEF